MRRKEPRDRGKEPCEDRGRDRSEVATAKEWQEPPEAGGGRERFSPRDAAGSETLLIA